MGGSEAAQLFLRLGKVNQQITDLCKPIIRMAFNQYENTLLLNMEKNTMVEYPVELSILSQSAWSYEILSSFFYSQNLTPTWQDANGTWGWLDEDTGLWNGAMAMVSFMKIA